MKMRLAKTIRILLLIVACIVFCVGLSLTDEYNEELAHNPENIKIELLECSASSDDSYYYVDLSYKISNNTDIELFCVETTTYFRNQNGDLIGTVKSTHGSQMGYAALKLEPSKNVIQYLQLSEKVYSSSQDTLFVELYNNGIENLDITHEITYVKWSDGNQYYGSSN